MKVVSVSRTILILATASALCFDSAAQTTGSFSFEGAAGPGLPTGSAGSRLNTGFSLLTGAGWKFTPNVSGMLEFQYDRFSLTNGALQSFNQPAGFNRFWSLTVNPRYYIRPRARLSGYGTAGFGIASRTLAFTDPSQAQSYCDPYYGECFSSGAPVVASFTNYKGSYNAGGGITYALGDSGLKLVGDLRYNHFLAHANNQFITISFGILF